MDEKEKPEYKIGQEVIFKFGSGKAMGKIKSAVYDDVKKWLYIIPNPHDSKNPMYIAESDIIDRA